MTWGDLEPGDSLIGDTGSWAIVKVEPYEPDPEVMTYTILNLINAEIIWTEIHPRVRLDFFQVYKRE